MEQSYTIFTNNRPIEVDFDPALKGIVRIDGPSLSGEYMNNAELHIPLAKAIQQLREGSIHALRLIANETDLVMDAIAAAAGNYIAAAGGVVFNKENEILFIFRRGMWDLPKGKIDAGETAEAAAVREIMEETGLDKVTLDYHLMDTYHIYDEAGRTILKRTFWYRMHADKQPLLGQLEEGITEAAWKAANGLDEVYNNTHENIKLVLEAALKVSNP
ncbi:MAG: NUDIX domain-containing protein [Chitinophagales bacterium]|nr:NUDIX domain-containing protein [Chitinophagales bacterium]